MKPIMILLKKRFNNSINIYFSIHILLFIYIVYFEYHLLFGNPIKESKTAFLVINTLILIIDLIAWIVKIGRELYKYWFSGWRKFKDENGFYVNGYLIRLHSYWGIYQVFDKNSEFCIKAFAEKKDAIKYCKNKK